MNDVPSNPEQRILLTTIECIEKYGISGATNRRIAEAAGVNIAAINYYFRTKEILIQRVMEITLKNAFDLSDLPAMPGGQAQERCVAIFLKFLEGGLRYPNLTRAHFHSLLVEGQPDAALYRHVRQFVEEQARDLRERGATLEPEALQTVLMQIFFVVVMAALAPSLVEQTGVHLGEAQVRRVYVEGLVEGLLK
jgi:AcrR family transcriptional regulator